MRLLTSILTLTIIWLSGCASVPAEQDLFSGTYRFLDPSEKGYLVASSVGENKWNVQMSRNGELPATDPLSQGEPMVVAASELLASAFVGPTPTSQVSCLASSGRYAAPRLCKIPINVEFQVAQAMNQNARLRSATGYILLVATPAGVFAPDVIRSK